MEDISRFATHDNPRASRGRRNNLRLNPASRRRHDPRTNRAAGEPAKPRARAQGAARARRPRRRRALRLACTAALAVFAACFGARLPDLATGRSRRFAARRSQERSAPPWRNGRAARPRPLPDRPRLGGRALRRRHRRGERLRPHLHDGCLRRPNRKDRHGPRRDGGVLQAHGFVESNMTTWRFMSEGARALGLRSEGSFPPTSTPSRRRSRRAKPSSAAWGRRLHHAGALHRGSGSRRRGQAARDGPQQRREDRARMERRTRDRPMPQHLGRQRVIHARSRTASSLRRGLPASDEGVSRSTRDGERNGHRHDGRRDEPAAVGCEARRQRRGDDGGILPIVVMAMMRRNGTSSARRGTSARLSASPNEEDHEHEHLEARRILKPLHALEPLAGDEHLDDAHPEAPDQRYDGQRAQRVPKGTGPSPPRTRTRTPRPARAARPAAR